MANETRHVKQAFDNRMNDQLAGSTAIDYEATDFNTDAVTEWIRPRVFGYTPIAESGTQVGIRREAWTFSIDVFTRVGSGGETAYRSAELVDLIKAAFDRITLSVLNYSGDQAEEAQCYFGRAHVTPVATTKQGKYWLEQMNVTYEATLWA